MARQRGQIFLPMKNTRQPELKSGCSGVVLAIIHAVETAVLSGLSPGGFARRHDWTLRLHRQQRQGAITV